jgi:hypothetical protein
LSRTNGETVSAGLTEADIENLAIDWFRSLGYDCALGSEISPDGSRPLREAVTEPALGVSLRAAIGRLNPKLPATAVDDALRQALRQPTPSLVQNNLRFHQLLTDGVQVEFRSPDGKMVGAFARLIDFDDPRQNEFLVARQYIVRGDRGVLKRTDLVVFVNGLPLGVIEFKARFASEAEGILQAYDCALTILYHDAQIQHVQTWRSTDGPLMLEPKGGGGTDHHVVFEWVAEQGVDPSSSRAPASGSNPESLPRFAVDQVSVPWPAFSSPSSLH